MTPAQAWERRGCAHTAQLREIFISFFSLFFFIEIRFLNFPLLRLELNGEDALRDLEVGCHIEDGRHVECG